MATADPLKRWEVVDAVSHLLGAVSPSDRPPQIAARVHGTVRRVSGCDDPYCQVKNESNEAAMGLYPQAKELVAALDDPLQTAAKLAIIGNIMDSGVGLRLDLAAETGRANERRFATRDFDRFREEMARASAVLYLADNAGEVELDEPPALDLDYVTFSGMAEPTLASNLGEAIDEVKRRMHAPVAVLTNSPLVVRRG